MVAAIAGAWQGTEARYGVVPTLHASTVDDLIEVPPFAASDLDGQVYENPIPQIPLEADGLLSIRMPSEVARVPHWVFEIRDGEQFERFIPAGEGGTHILVDATTENGRLDAVSVTAQPTGFDADGEETAFAAEWAIDIEQRGDDVSPEGLRMHGEPSARSVETAEDETTAPDDATHSGATDPAATDPATGDPHTGLEFGDDGE